MTESEKTPQKKKGPPHGGGSRKGRPNRMTGAHQDFLNAWDKECGPETACRLMKTAKRLALGHEVVEETFGIGGQIQKRVRRFEYDFGPLEGIYPYIARKMPERHELAPVEAMDPDEVDRVWSRRQSSQRKAQEKKPGTR